MTSFARVWDATTSVQVRWTDVEVTVFSAVCEVAALNTPFGVHVKSARSSSRSYADLSRPVTSWTPRGVANWRSVMSLMIATGVPPESSRLAVVHPRPEVLLMATVLLDEPAPSGAGVGTRWPCGEASGHHRAARWPDCSDGTGAL